MKTNNYELSRDRAQAYFLGFDQMEAVRQWNLKHDETHLFAELFGREYAICRKTGQVRRCWTGEQANYAEVLSLFDLLCHEGGEKRLAREFAPVNSLNGRPVAGVGTDFHGASATRFDRDVEGFCRGCRELGGIPVDLGDYGFRFRVFGEMEVILKFYRADEDFPASLTLLWDKNTLQFVYYETVFYLAGCLLAAVEEKM